MDSCVGKVRLSCLFLCFLSSAYSQLCSQLLSSSFMGADSFYVRVNLNMEPHGDPPSLGVSCDDIIHVTDTRYNGKYHWRCSLVDPLTAKPLQAGTMPNYNRYASVTGLLRLYFNSGQWGFLTAALKDRPAWIHNDTTHSGCKQAILSFAVVSILIMQNHDCELFFPHQGTTIATCKAPKNGLGTKGLQKEGCKSTDIYIKELVAPVNTTNGYLFSSMFLYAVLEEIIQPCTTGQGSGSQRPRDWFHTAGPLHPQQT